MVSVSEIFIFNLFVEKLVWKSCFSSLWAAHLTALTSSQSSCCNLTFMRCHFSLCYLLDWCWPPNPTRCLSFHATFSSEHIPNPFSMIFMQTGLLCTSVSSTTSLWKCSWHAWMGGDLGMELGHTKGTTSPSWHGSFRDSLCVTTKKLLGESTNWLLSFSFFALSATSVSNQNI